VKIGNATAVSRKDLIDRLESGSDLKHSSARLDDGVADAGGDSRATDRLATPAVDPPTRPHDTQEESSGRVSMKQRYEEFCLAKVKDHLRALPQPIRSQRFEETRSAIRRAVPQLRRNEVDEMAQRELESRICAGLHLPSIEEFTAGSV
jgi:hypothetical protein